jgi:hypothetical protein
LIISEPVSIREQTITNATVNVCGNGGVTSPFLAKGELREALKFLGHDRVDTEAVFEEARLRVPMPEMPKSLLPTVTTDEEMEEPQRRLASINRKKFDGFKWRSTREICPG